MDNSKIEQPQHDERDEQVSGDKRPFQPVISKITKPLKPQGVHAGSTKVVVKGNF